MVDLTKLSDDELRSIASGNLKDLPEETLRLISGATAPAGSAPPIGMDAAPAIEEKFDKDFEEKKAQIKRDQEAKAQEITTTSPFTLPGLLSSPPAAIVTGAALLGAGYGVGRYGPEIADKAKGAYKSIKERFISNPVEAPVRIEPIGFESFADMDLVDQPSAQALDNLRRADELTEANRRLGIGGNQPVAPGPIARNALPMGAVNPEMFSSSAKAPEFDAPPATPFSSAPPGAPAPESSAGPNSSTTSIVNNTVKEMIDEVDKPPQGIYRDAAGNLVYPEQMSPGARAGAEAFAQQYPEQAAALEAEKRFAILGAGAADNNLYNAYGAELRKEILKEVNQGQPAGVYSNYTSKINPAIKAIPPDSALGKQLEDLRVNQPKSATRGSLGVSAAATPTGLVQGSKIADALKNAGKVALVMSMADAANAATKGDYTGAAKIAGPALDPTGILEAAINPQSTARNITNVSPIFGFFSQLIANQADERAKQAYIEKVGGGRGLTPASAYRR
jgi:hypothetical protein